MDNREYALNDEYDKLRLNQSFSKAILVGLLMAILSAVIWGAIVHYRGKHFAGMPILPGFLVGLGINKYGKGVDYKFSVIGVLFTIIGIALAYIFIVVDITMSMKKIEFQEIAMILEPKNIEVMKIVLKGLVRDLGYIQCIISMFLGFRISRRYVRIKK